MIAERRDPPHERQAAGHADIVCVAGAPRAPPTQRQKPKLRERKREAERKRETEREGNLTEKMFKRVS